MRTHRLLHPREVLRVPGDGGLDGVVREGGMLQRHPRHRVQQALDGADQHLRRRVRVSEAAHRRRRQRAAL